MRSHDAEILFTDAYCKVCSAQLISQSQRVAHYEVRHKRLSRREDVPKR
uniref:C2H2-type domain-containing protein n=1 Tax=Callorhinchus milii TaxID=7868 RepID=A0A4W3HEY6_CALMI